jgi:hypothetical protein
MAVRSAIALTIGIGLLCLLWPCARGEDVAAGFHQEKGAPVPMRDSVVLRANVTLPPEIGPVVK